MAKDPLKYLPAQVVVRKCCGKVVAFMYEPACYMDAAWFATIKANAAEGHTITVKRRYRVEVCNCKEMAEEAEKKKQLNLFEI